MAGEVAPMDVRLLAAVTAQSLKEINVRAVCAERGISRKTFYKWRDRYVAEGMEGLTPRSRRPRRSPQRIGLEIEDEIVRLRKELGDLGVDNGPDTIRWRLQQHRGGQPVPAT